MNKSQESAHKRIQLEMYNMSQIHKLIRVDGDHMSFFEQAKNSIVMDALNSMLLMSQPRLKDLSKNNIIQNRSTKSSRSSRSLAGSSIWLNAFTFTNSFINSKDAKLLLSQRIIYILA